MYHGVQPRDMHWLKKTIRVIVGIPVAGVYALTAVLYKLMFFLPSKLGLPLGDEGMEQGDMAMDAARSWISP